MQALTRKNVKQVNKYSHSTFHFHVTREVNQRSFSSLTFTYCKSRSGEGFLQLQLVCSSKEYRLNSTLDIQPVQPVTRTAQHQFQKKSNKDGKMQVGLEKSQCVKLHEGQRREIGKEGKENGRGIKDGDVPKVGKKIC